VTARDGGAELHPGTALIRGGTSSVLPVQRNPVTTTLAYNDNTKQRLNDNNNVSTADFASRVNPLAYLYTCAF